MAATKIEQSTDNSRDVLLHCGSTLTRKRQLMEKVLVKLQQPLHSQDTIKPQAIENWSIRVEKSFDRMEFLEDRRVPLAIFLLDGESTTMLGVQAQRYCSGALVLNSDIVEL
ncbi:hypothetical protein IEQ34_008337 [Dendrobium chrysotoxum]|uniref:Uncharacterized protein n=1 Tax=Dendrobium chrysotoxum TaxID=161865 RepID=A0AAV7GXR0_DENCH|nr:hypothetical protein IEQ34_008337 [Dendrobium chrysotoxum]